MSIINNFRNAVIATPLLVSQALADGIDHAPTLTASPTVETALTPIRSEFMKLAGMNVVIISPDLLLTSEELSETAILSDMGINASSLIYDDQEVLDKLVQAYSTSESNAAKGFQELQEKWHDLSLAQQSLFSTFLRAEYDNIAHGHAMAIKTTTSTSCTIISPRTDRTAQQALGDLAYMPARVIPSIPQSISQQNAYLRTMAHEATHCGQDFAKDHGSELNNSLRSIHHENGGDHGAHTVLQDDQDLVQAAQAMRNIGNLRLGADFFSETQRIPAHVIFSFDEEPSFDYNEADIAIAAKMLQTATNIYSGSAYGYHASHSINPNIQYIELDILEPDYFAQLASAGQAFNHEYPELEYSTLKAIYEIFFDIYESDDIFDQIEQPAVARAMIIAREMTKNYLTAMETYFPQVTNNPLALKNYAKIIKMHEQAIENHTGSTRDQETVERLEIPTNSKEFLQMLIRQIEEMQTSPEDTATFPPIRKFPSLP